MPLAAYCSVALSERRTFTNKIDTCISKVQFILIRIISQAYSIYSPSIVIHKNWLHKHAFLPMADNIKVI